MSAVATKKMEELVVRTLDGEVVFKLLPSGELKVQIDTRYQPDGVGGYEDSTIPPFAVMDLLRYLRSEVK